ncbi:TniQ family protein [Devosia chinhatensis]|uniref:TniQ domain-containing protein n=1 Tax=Devosia chinhatensis TaxID=429727 RepID=A0A0F5FLM0_9HYPH|nr:TniQ family protein [Devosia chinhatensis]KKB09465.1 hypothetical protein VE26_05960 [Devosia chinhatensis]
MSIFRSHNAPRLRHMEIPASFVSRLAAWLRYTNAKLFCTDFGLEFEGISAGRPDQLQGLADLTGQVVEDLGHGPVRSGRRFLIDGQLLSTAFLDRVDLWVCPECVAEDMAAAPHLPPEATIAVRRDNVVTAIGSCHIHGRSFVHAGRSPWRAGNHDTSLTTIDIPARLPELTAMSLQTGASPFDAFVRLRMEGGGTDHPLLGAIPLMPAIQLCGRVGNAVLNHGLPNQRRLLRPELNRLYNAGLTVLDGGEDALAALMEELGARIPAGSTVSPKVLMPKVWGLLERCTHDDAYGPIRDAMSGAASRSLFGQYPWRMLGGSAKSRRWQSLLTIQQQHGIGRSTARTFARLAGAFHPQHGTWVDADVFERWMALDAGLVPSWQAGRDVGASPQAMASLIAGGHLVPVGEVRPRQGAFPWLRRQQVKDLFSSMLASAQPCNATDEGRLSIVDIPSRVPGALPALHDAIVQGRIKVWRLINEKPYPSIVVELDAVFGLLSPGESNSMEFLSPAQFARRCGIGSSAGHALVEMGMFRSETRLNRETGLRRRSIPASEVDRFEAEYITGTKLARTLRVQPRDVIAVLAERGVHPQDTGDAPITLFLRSDLAAAV